MDKIAELIYHAYEQKYVKEGLMSDEHHEKFKKFISTLNKQQRDAYYELDFMQLELLIAHETRAIKYMLELLEPELAD